MTRRRSVSLPSYRLHKQSGQAVVTLRDTSGRRRDVLLGPFDTPASRAEYARVLGEWEAAGRRAPLTAGGPGLTVAEMLLAYLRFAELHYRHADGTPTSELDGLKLTIRTLRELYGHTPAADFGPLALKAVRERMVKDGLCRNVVNQRTGRIKRMFKWAVSEQLIPPAVLVGLQAVTGLRSGRTEARESDPVKPVPAEHVDAALAFLLPPAAAMVQLQRLTGMRPGEAIDMRAVDIDTTGAVWVYRPARHKGKWRGKDRVVCLGPKAQAVVREFLQLDVHAWLFSPRRAFEQLQAQRRAGRKSKLWPSHVRHQAAKRKAKPRRPRGEKYTVMTYGRAIARACEQAGVPHWHPNQLRHLHATEVRRRYGLEAAQVALGHSSADVTQIYAERNLALAEKIAAEVG